MRIGACAGDSVRYRHAFFQVVVEGTPETPDSLPASGVSPLWGGTMTC